MRRHWSGYIEALLDIRHADVDIEVSGRKALRYLV